MGITRALLLQVAVICTTFAAPTSTLPLSQLKQIRQGYKLPPGHFCLRASQLPSRPSFLFRLRDSRLLSCLLLFVCLSDMRDCYRYMQLLLDLLSYNIHICTQRVYEVYANYCRTPQLRSRLLFVFAPLSVAPLPALLTHGIGTPDPNPKHLVNWCF